MEIREGMDEEEEDDRLRLSLLVLMGFPIAVVDFPPDPPVAIDSSCLPAPPPAVVASASVLALAVPFVMAAAVVVIVGFAFTSFTDFMGAWSLLIPGCAGGLDRSVVWEWEVGGKEGRGEGWGDGGWKARGVGFLLSGF